MIGNCQNVDQVIIVSTMDTSCMAPLYLDLRSRRRLCGGCIVDLDEQANLCKANLARVITFPGAVIGFALLTLQHRYLGSPTGQIRNNPLRLFTRSELLSLHHIAACCS